MNMVAILNKTYLTCDLHCCVTKTKKTLFIPSSCFNPLLGFHNR